MPIGVANDTIEIDELVGDKTIKYLSKQSKEANYLLIFIIYLFGAFFH